MNLTEQYYEKLSMLIREDSPMLSDINKLFCPDAKIQTTSQSKQWNLSDQSERNFGDTEERNGQSESILADY